MSEAVRMKHLGAMRRYLLAGAGISIGLVAGLGGWAATAEIAGAVIAPGFLVVDSSVKKVQHLTGGIVGELRVRNGDHVATGDLLVRLDDTQLRANLGIITKGLDELWARRSRLEAERDDLESLIFPDELLARGNDPELARVLAGENKLFELRRTSRTGKKEQLRARIGQFQEEIDGLQAEIAAKDREITLIATELEGVRQLWDKKLIQLSRLTELERASARLDGERGQLIAEAARSKGKISETELQILQIDQDLRSEVGRELAEVRGKTTELVERRIAAEDLLKRVDIRAPQSGKIHQLAVHTVGGVVTPGEPLMLIVPDNDTLKIEARLSPKDIDQIRPNQKVILRFSSFSLRTTPELTGYVTMIAADLTTDEKTGAGYYTVQIGLSDQELARLGALKLVPGMPAESFIQTGERTVLSYFVKPFSDQIARALRED